MDQLSCNNSRLRVPPQMTQGHLRQRQHLHLVLQRHPRPTPVLLHQTQGTVDTRLSQSAQRAARKLPNHEYCQTASVPVAHSRRSRPARQMELTRSREVEVAQGPPLYLLVCHHPVPLLRSSAANGRRTKRKRLRPHQIRLLRLQAASQNSRNEETATVLGPDGQPIELEDIMVIEWLPNTPNAKTRDFISHFTPCLRTDEQKTKFTVYIKEVAQLKNGILVLERISWWSGEQGIIARTDGHKVGSTVSLAILSHCMLFPHTYSIPDRFVHIVGESFYNLGRISRYQEFPRSVRRGTASMTR